MYLQAAALCAANMSNTSVASDGNPASGEPAGLLRRSASGRKDHDSTALHRILKRVSTINSKRRFSGDGVNLASALALDDDDDDKMVPIPEPEDYSTSSSSEEDEPPCGNGRCVDVLMCRYAAAVLLALHVRRLLITTQAA